MAPHCMNVGITATVTEFSGIPAYTPYMKFTADVVTEFLLLSFKEKGDAG